MNWMYFLFWIIGVITTLVVLFVWEIDAKREQAERDEKYTYHNLPDGHSARFYKNLFDKVKDSD